MNTYIKSEKLYEEEDDEEKNQLSLKLSKTRGGFITRHNTKKRVKTIPLYKYYHPYQNKSFSPSFPVSEKNGRMNAELSFINPYYKVTSCWVDENDGKPQIFIIPDLNASILEIPWEYNVEFLKSIGSSEAYEWADLISDFNKKMYLECSDKNQISSLQKFIESTMNYHQKQIDLKNKYPYAQIHYEMFEDQPKTTMISFSEKMLEYIGFTRENFASWVLKNGIPQICETDIEYHTIYMKKFYELATGRLAPDSEIDVDYELWLDDKAGKRRKFKSKITMFGEVSLDNKIRFEINLFLMSDVLAVYDCEPDPDYFDLNDGGKKNNDMDEFMKKFYQYICTKLPCQEK